MRSDLYSLAVTLHHLLTDETPWSAVERRLKIADGHPDPLRPLHELKPEIPAAIAAILQSAAALNPDERPATAAEMRVALRDANRPDPSPPPAEPTTIDPPPPPGTPPDNAPGSQSGEPSTIERPRPQPAAPAAEPSKVDQPIKSPNIAQPRSNRRKYAAAGVVLALAIGLVMFLIRNSSAPANASSEAKPLSLVPSSVADSPTPPASQPAALQSFAEDLGNGVKLEMVAISGGTFLMGSPDGQGSDAERPQHRVTVPGFSLGKYEVTQAQWQAVMRNNPSYFKGDNLPVENVSWDDAKEFCAKLSRITGKTYHLPSEAEWEYACRAQTTSPYAGDLEAMAWYSANSGGKTHPVGQKQANAFGLFDMHGNAWEWCEDDWHHSYKGAPTGGRAWVDGPSRGVYRLYRGGCWYCTIATCPSARRDTNFPSYRGNGVGFRVVGEVKNK